MSADAKQSFPSRSSRSERGSGLIETVVLLGSTVLLVWGGLYVGSYSGRFDGSEFSEVPHGRPTKPVAVSADPNAAVLKAGLTAYNNSCVACHQADGNGNPSLNIPPLAGSDWVLAEAPSRIVRIVLHGLGGPVKVKDTVWSGGAMNPWLKTADNPAGLTPDEIAATLSYVRNSWGNKASLVSTGQVTAILKETEKRSDPWTEQELLKVPLAAGAPAMAALTPDQLKLALKALPADALEALLKDVKK